MNLRAFAEVMLLIVPTLGLFGLGALLSLRSGVAGLVTGSGLRQMLGNLGSTLAVIMATLLAVRIIQRLAGFPFWDW